MAKSFITTNTVNYHLKEIFKSKELSEDSVIRKIRITAEDCKNYFTNFYSLDAIISVGYRVNSHEATQFRIWATKTLREYIIKGFALDDERLKNGHHFDKKYFIDYDLNSEITKNFFATVQNKLHFAITTQKTSDIPQRYTQFFQEESGIKGG